MAKEACAQLVLLRTSVFVFGHISTDLQFKILFILDLVLMHSLKVSQSCEVKVSQGFPEQEHSLIYEWTVRFPRLC
jgi:hypothetical protein